MHVADSRRRVEGERLERARRTSDPLIPLDRPFVSWRVTGTMRTGRARMRSAGSVAWLVVALVMWARAASAQAPVAPALEAEPSRVTVAESGATLFVPRVSRPPAIEEYLYGAGGERDAQVSGFRQREPRDGDAAGEETTVHVSYDDTHLYAVFVCRGDPERIRARMARRGDIAADDRVALYLDTYRDGQRAYVFAVNPLGVQRDAVLTEGASEDDRFETVWRSQARLTADGYVVLMAIPFRSLRFPSTFSQSWGVAFERTRPRAREVSYWPYITRRVAGFVPQMAALEGLDGVSPGRNVQLIPYVSGLRGESLDPRQGGMLPERDRQAGLDAKVVVRDTFTFDVALNPDFSHVEADTPQVTVNQRYEVYFPERRPYFLENAAFFETPVDLFFSRRIVDPTAGVRLTGKAGPWTVGVLAGDDRAPGQGLPAADPLSGARALHGMARVQREFANQSTIGLLATSRHLAGDWNRVASLDSRVRLGRNWFVTGQAALSRQDQPEGGGRSGTNYLAEVRHSGRHFTYAGAYSDVSPHFETGLGFVRRVDVRQASHYAGYFWQPAGGRLQNVGPSASVQSNWDRAGRVQDWSTSADFTMDFAGPVGFTASWLRGHERYLGQGFRTERQALAFYANRWRRLFLNAEFGVGRAVNYAPAPGVLPFAGRATDALVGVTLRPTRRLQFDQTYFYTGLRTPAGQRLDLPQNALVFDNHLTRSRLHVQVSRELSVRLIADYYGLRPGADLFAQERSRQVTGDVLLTYLLNPGTALHVGYTSGWEDLLEESGPPLVLRRGGRPVYDTGSQLFVKVSYLLRF
jgi:hypothetical protein